MCNVRKFLTIFFALSLPLWLPPVAVGKTPSEQLKEVKSQIQKEEERLATIERDKKELMQSLDGAQVQLERASKERERLSGELETIETSILELSQIVADTKVKSHSQRDLLKKRIVATYKLHRRSTVLDLFARATSTTDLLKRTHLFTRIVSHDHEALTRLSSLIEEFQSEKKDLERLDTQKRDRVENLKELGVKLEKARLEQASLLRETEQKEEEHRAIITKLQISADRLERVLAGIMGGVDSKSDSKTVSKSEDEGFQGKGLASLKGKLALPVPGTIVQRFGKQKHESFSDFVFVKGLEIKAPVGVEVKAVAAGKIIFNQVLPGYGNVIIVDHGKRYYTLYGRLATSVKRVGDYVQAKDVLAFVGEVDEKGKNFYFELRLKGSAIDPSTYLAAVSSGKKST